MQSPVIDGQQPATSGEGVPAGGRLFLRLGGVAPITDTRLATFAEKGGGLSTLDAVVSR